MLASIPSPHPQKLIEQIQITARLKHFSLKTEKSYLHYIRDFIRFNQMQHPREMGVTEIRNYLSYLAIDKHVAASTQNVALSALLFLYNKVLKIELPFIQDIERPHRAQRLPVVFSREEVQRIFTHLDGVNWLMASLLYGAGLRLNECLHLRVKNLDFDYSQITVRDGKGYKDRRTMLPTCFFARLQSQLQYVKEIFSMT